MSRLSNALRNHRQSARARKNLRRMSQYSPTLRDELIVVAQRNNGIIR